MIIYKISQTNFDLHIKRDDMGDRVRYYLIDENGKEAGKLTIQDFGDRTYYYLTSFRIDQQYRKQGFGKKIISEALNDSRFFDRPILVRPDPFDEETSVQDLIGMYSHFGFRPFETSEGYMIYPSREKA